MIDFFIENGKIERKELYIMDINEKSNGVDTVELFISGRLDTTTAPQLESRVRECAKGYKVLVLDLKDVEYISSAGLRIVLMAHKLMAGINGRLAVRNPSEFCTQVFEATGMDSVLSIV